MGPLRISTITSSTPTPNRVVSWEEEVRQWKSRQEVADGLPLLLQVHCGELDRNRFACKCCEPFNSLIGFQDFEPIVDTMWQYICLEVDKQKLHLAELIKEALLYKKISTASSFVRFLLPMSTSGHRVCFAKFSALSLFPAEYMKQLLDQSKRHPAPVCDGSPAKRLKLSTRSTSPRKDETKTPSRKRQIRRKTAIATVSPEKTAVAANERAVGSGRKLGRRANSSEPNQSPAISPKRSPQHRELSPDRKLRSGRMRACWSLEEPARKESPATARSRKPPPDKVPRTTHQRDDMVDVSGAKDSDRRSKNMQEAPTKMTPPEVSRVRCIKNRLAPCVDKRTDLKDTESESISSRDMEQLPQPLLEEPSVTHNTAKRKLRSSQMEIADKVSLQGDNMGDLQNQSEDDWDSDGSPNNLQETPTKISSPEPSIVQCTKHKPASYNKARDSDGQASRTKSSREGEQLPQPLLKKPMVTHNTAKRKLESSQMEIADEVLLEGDDLGDLQNHNEGDWGSDGSPNNLQEAPTKIASPEPSSVQCSNHKPYNKATGSEDTESRTRSSREGEPLPQPLLKEPMVTHNKAKRKLGSSLMEIADQVLLQCDDMGDLQNHNEGDWGSDGSPNNLQEAPTKISSPEPSIVQCTKHKPASYNKATDSEAEESIVKLPRELEARSQPLPEKPRDATHKTAKRKPISSQNEIISEVLIQCEDTVALSNPNHGDDANDDSPKNPPAALTELSPLEMSRVQCTKPNSMRCNKTRDSKDKERSPQPLPEEQHATHNTAKRKPSSSQNETTSEALVHREDIVDLSNETDSDYDSDSDSEGGPENLPAASTKLSPLEHKPTACTETRDLGDKEQGAQPPLQEPHATHNAAKRKPSPSHKENTKEMLIHREDIVDLSNETDSDCDGDDCPKKPPAAPRKKSPLKLSRVERTKHKPMLCSKVRDSEDKAPKLRLPREQERRPQPLLEEHPVTHSTAKQKLSSSPKDIGGQVLIQREDLVDLSKHAEVVLWNDLSSRNGVVQEGKSESVGVSEAQNQSVIHAGFTDSETGVLVEGTSERVPVLQLNSNPLAPKGHEVAHALEAVALAVALNNNSKEVDEEQQTTKMKQCGRDEITFTPKTQQHGLQSATEVQGPAVQRCGSTASSDGCPATVSPDNSCDDRGLQSARVLSHVGPHDDEESASLTKIKNNSQVAVSQKPIPRLVHATRKSKTVSDIGGTGTSRPMCHPARPIIGLGKLGRQRRGSESANPRQALLSNPQQKLSTVQKRQPTPDGAEVKHAPVAAEHGTCGQGDDLEILSVGSNDAEKEETLSTHPRAIASNPQANTVASPKHVPPKEIPDNILVVGNDDDECYSSGDECFSENWTRHKPDPNNLRMSQSLAAASQAMPTDSPARQPSRRELKTTSPQAFFGNTRRATSGFARGEDESESSDDSVWEDAYASFEQAKQAECTVKDFCEIWESVEKDWGEETKDIENGKLIRAANHRKSSPDQISAQYGRITFFATAKLFEELNLNPSSDIFVDFGHGVGNAVVQAAFTLGCRARGIEVDPDRYKVSQIFHQCFVDSYVRLWHDRDGVSFNPGNIELKCGRLEDTAHEDFLTTGGCIKAFCNNFNGVFGRKCVRVGRAHSLDDNLAGLFGLMPKGSVLITFSKLNFLVPPGSQISQLRQAAGLPEVESPGFYEEEEIWLGSMKDSVSWAAAHNTKDLKAFKYTLTNNGSFLCWNPRCQSAQNGEVLSASRFFEKGHYWIPNSCSCGANSGMSLRQKRQRKWL